MNQSLPHLIPHDIQPLDLSKPNIASSLKVLPPSVKLFEGIMHTGIATLKGISPVEDVITRLERITMNQCTGVSESNLTDIRGKNPQLERQSYTP